MNSAENLLRPATQNDTVIPITAVNADTLDAVIKSLPGNQQAWIAAQNFTIDTGSYVCLPNDGGEIVKVLAAVNKTDHPFEVASLASQLPPGLYQLDDSFKDRQQNALGWLLESYRFTRYKSAKPVAAALVAPDDIDHKEIISIASAINLVRDLINTPALDMGPDELQAATEQLAKTHDAKLSVIDGDTLVKEFPMIHAVGMASDRRPRLLDLQWGDPSARKLTLVGKGVCFDTGGLDIKPSSSMLLMKKDMGGAAHVLGLAAMIMGAQLPVKLRVLIPCVENSIAGNAFRPGDILKSRKGISVEIGNTDAEGRLVLADALDLADSEEPDLLLDMATLTGAARVALGPDLPPYFCENEQFCQALETAARTVHDPLWRLPYWQPYNKLLASTHADINNVGTGGFAGAITAALFLLKFVEKTKCYAHFDVFGWAPTASPGRPKGGEAYAIRALFEMLKQRYS